MILHAKLPVVLNCGAGCSVHSASHSTFSLQEKCRCFPTWWDKNTKSQDQGLGQLRLFLWFNWQLVRFASLSYTINDELSLKDETETEIKTICCKVSLSFLFWSCNGYVKKHWQFILFGDISISFYLSLSLSLNLSL